MQHLPDGVWLYVALLLTGSLATEVWRWLGLAVGGRMAVDGNLFQLVRMIATALVAGMATRMVLFPAGALAQMPLHGRLGAFAGGLAIYFLARRSLVAGVAGGAGLLAATQLLRP
jgi:hypothetical protein